MVKIKVGDLESQLIADPQTVGLVAGALRYERDYYERALKQFNIPKYVYMIDKKGRFLSGLVDEVVSLLRVSKIPFEIIDERSVKEHPPVDEIAIRLKEMPFSLRDYQTEALLACIAHTRGIVHSCTGSGKSIIIAALIKAWWRKTLVLVNSKDLMYQLQQELSEYMGEDVGLIGDGRYQPKFITVGLIQTLQGKRSTSKRQQQIKEYTESVECLVCDEVHNAQSRSYRFFMRALKNASLRYGFSATPETSKVKLEGGGTGDRDIVLRAYFGPTLFQLKTGDLIKRGYLAQPTVYVVQNSVYVDSVKLLYNEEYERIIMEDEDRNRLAAKIIADAYFAGRQVIGFVHRIDHGKKIAEVLIEEYGVKAEAIGYATGEALSTDRKEMIQGFKDGDLPILMGTVLNEGLNFFTEVGINISGGDSHKTTVQRIGRVLRKPRDPKLGDVDISAKRFVDYYDFADRGHPYFSKHSKNRVETYQQEGHKVIPIDTKDVMKS